MATTRLRGRLWRHVPGLVLARRYPGAWWRPDLVAGATVGAMLVPQAMAYAELAGLPAVAGLYAALAPLGAYAVFGSSRQVVVGPESTTAIMVSVSIAPLAGGDVTTFVELAGASALLMGAVFLVAGIARLGFLADLLSHPVLLGYMTGLGFVMIGSQFERFTGVPVPADEFVQQVADLFTNLDEVHGPTFALALAVLTFIVLVHHRWKRAPAYLIAVLASTAAVAILDLEEEGVRVVGAVPAGLPELSLPSVTAAQLLDLVPSVLAIALVAFADTILTARSFASKSGYPIDPNQELVALSTANLASGVTQGFAVSSSASRTAVGDAAGSRSQLTGLVAAACVLVVLLFGNDLLARFPQAALAAIVVEAALRLLDFRGIWHLKRVRVSELVIALAAVVGVLVLGIFGGVVVAVVLSVLNVLRRTARPHDAVLGRVDRMDSFHNVERWREAQVIPGLVVYRFDAPLYFANSAWFKRRVLFLVDTEPERVLWLLLDAEGVTDLDSTAVRMLEELLDELDRRDVTLAVCRSRLRLRRLLERTGLALRIGPERFFPTTDTAVAAYREAVGRRG